MHSASEKNLILLLSNKDWTFKTQSKPNIDTAAVFIGLVAEIDTGRFFILLASTDIHIFPSHLPTVSQWYSTYRSQEFRVL